jgi:hypothetical protein
MPPPHTGRLQVHQRTPSPQRVAAGFGTLAIAVAALAVGTSAANAAVPVAASDTVPAACAHGPSEWVRCVTVTAKLDRAPAVGKQAHLRLSVTSAVANDDLKIQVELPAALRFEAPAAGFTVERKASLVPSDKGTVSRMSATVDARAGRVLHYSAGVTAVTAGPTTLRMAAVSPRGPEFGSDEVHVPLVIGMTATDSVLGSAKGPDTAEQTPASTPLVDANPAVPYRPASTAGLPKPYSDDPVPPTSKIVQPTPDSFIRNRLSATAASANGPGQPETISYTAGQAGCVGVVLINKAGSGTYTLTRS